MNGLMQKKWAVALISFTVSGGLAYASCGGTEPMVAGETGSLVGSVSSQMLAGALSIIQQSILQSGNKISAMKTATKQEAVSSEKKIMAMRSAAAGFATTYTSARSSAQVYDIYNRYRSQGFDPCGNRTLTDALRTRETSANQTAAQRINTEIDTAPGRFANPVVALKGRVDEHKSLFCTQAEVDAGVCGSVGALPGGDSNAALLFTEADAGDAVSTAKNAFINNLFGLPDSPAVFNGKAAAPESAAALNDKHRRDALNSIAMFSFKTIQSEHEKDATGKSLAGLIQERVATYFGSTKSQQWAQALAAQEQRGVLVDMVKMEGVALKMAERRVKQNMRLEANLAGLVAVHNEASNGK